MDQKSPEPPPTHLPGLDENEQLCWQQFTDVVTHLYAALNRQLTETHQLALFDVRVLRLLANSDGGSARMGELAQAMAVIPSRVSERIRRLESQALVRRSRSPDDRRGVIATITPQGRARLKPALRTYAGAIRKLYLDPMSRRQMTALSDSCRRIGIALRDPDKPAKSEQ